MSRARRAGRHRPISGLACCCRGGEAFYPSRRSCRIQLSCCPGCILQVPGNFNSCFEPGDCCCRCIGQCARRWVAGWRGWALRGHGEGEGCRWSVSMGHGCPSKIGDACCERLHRIGGKEWTSSGASTDTRLLHSSHGRCSRCSVRGSGPLDGPPRQPGPGTTWCALRRGPRPTGRRRTQASPGRCPIWRTRCSGTCGATSSRCFLRGPCTEAAPVIMSAGASATVVRRRCTWESRLYAECGMLW